MACTLMVGGKHVHAKLTGAQKVERHIRHLPLAHDVSKTCKAFTQEASILTQKHGQ